MDSDCDTSKIEAVQLEALSARDLEAAAVNLSASLVDIKRACELEDEVVEKMPPKHKKAYKILHNGVALIITLVGVGSLILRAFL